MSQEIMPMPAAEKPLLARLSISMFSMVMGIGGLANAWVGAHRVFGLPLVISQILLFIAVLSFVVLVLLHLAKLKFCFAEVMEEFAHPVRSSFFPAVSVATVVLSIGLRPISGHWRMRCGGLARPCTSHSL